MIAGSQLAERHNEQTMSSSSASNPLRIAWHEVRFPVQIIAKLRAAIEAGGRLVMRMKPASITA
jgi:hypothetical protein